MSGLVLPGQPRTIDMSAWDTLGPQERLDALHAGFHDLHARLRAQEKTSAALAAQVNIAFELWAVVSTLVEVGPGRGRHGRRHFLAAVEQAKRAINRVSAGGPRTESHAHQLLDAIKAMNEAEAMAMAKAMKAAAAKAQAEKPGLTDEAVAQVAAETREAIREHLGVAAVAKEILRETCSVGHVATDGVCPRDEWVPEPGVLLGAAVAARAEQQEAGGEPLTRVRVEFKPRDAHRLALASEGFVLEGPGEESVGSVLLRIARTR